MPRKYPPGYIMPGISHVLDCHDQPIEVIPIADLHIGDPNADMSLIKSLINGVRENPNRYTVLCGDLMNTAIIGSKSDTYGELNESGLILMHAEDQLMSAETFRIMAEEFIEVYKKIEK